MRTLAFTRNGSLATFAQADSLQSVSVHRHSVVNNASTADWAAEAALHHHGATRYAHGEYPECFAEFFCEYPCVEYCRVNGGFIYTWPAQEVSILIQD